MSVNPENNEILNKLCYIFKIYYLQWKPKQPGMKEMYNLRPSAHEPFGYSINENNVFQEQYLCLWTLPPKTVTWLSLGHLRCKISAKNWWSYPEPTHSSVFSSVFLATPFLYSLSRAPNLGAIADSSLSYTHIWCIHRSTHLVPLHHLLPGSPWGCSNLISCFLPSPV